MQFPRFLLAGLLTLAALPALGQANRLHDHNQIGWYVYEGDHTLGARWAIHTEYQARRTHYIRDWQQALVRLGVAYQLRPRLQASGGYTSLVTHPYGDYPTADTGVPFPEHRLYQDLTLSDTLGRLALEHRVRLEQRWLGQLPEGGSRRVQDWQYQNRIRYQLAATLPLQGPTLDDHEFYLNAFDEVFLSFGRQVGLNVFNQNRISAGLGYQLQEDFRVELNYLNQITQHAEPEPLSGKPVFEFNNGFRFGVVYNLTLFE